VREHERGALARALQRPDEVGDSPIVGVDGVPDLRSRQRHRVRLLTRFDLENGGIATGQLLHERGQSAVQPLFGLTRMEGIQARLTHERRRDSPYPCLAQRLEPGLTKYLDAMAHHLVTLPHYLRQYRLVQLHVQMQEMLLGEPGRG
jgi:hypothetical protein